MFASKLTISKETLNKNELTARERNSKYWMRIKELAAYRSVVQLNYFHK